MNDEEVIDYIKKYFIYNDDGTFTRTDRKNSKGSLDKDGYLIIKIKGKKYRAHRLVYAYHNGHFPSLEIDHINRDRTDNRIENLNGLFAIDDNKDADSTNTHGKDIKPNMTPVSGLSEAQIKRLFAIGNKAGFKKDVVEATVKKMFGCEPKDMTKDQYNTVCERLEKKVK